MAPLKLEYSVEEPLNREPPVAELVNSLLTPHGLNYDRNHGPIPHLSADEHRVRISGDFVPRPLTLSVQDLATSFPQHTVTCALACAGNRRHAMRTRIKEVQGINWFNAAIMNCRWEGPTLRDVLKRAGIIQDAVKVANGPENPAQKGHVQFACHQTECQQDSWYGGSIGLKIAMSEHHEVVLALKMNGEPLPIKHGFPVRVVVPGIIGARSVKWLDTIIVSDRESPNFYQQHDYKILPPEAIDSKSAEKHWATTPPMMDMPINSVISHPSDNSTVRTDEKGRIEVRGYAVPQGNQGPVTKVEVSADEGKKWVEAGIVEGKESGKWSWVLWQVRVQIPRGKGRKLVCRATDTGGNTQPRQSEWNLRGVGYNGWGERFDLEII